MAKYLITGGAGFIGSNFAYKVVEEGNEVVIVDDLSMGLLRNIEDLPEDKCTFYNESITNYDFMTKLLLKERFDYIVLLAAIASVADSVARPYDTHLVNQEANIHILETIRKYGIPVKKIIFASSAAVYGDDPELPKKETSPICPLTPYAIDKFASERYVLTYGRLYNIPTVATRFFNVYGPKQNPNSPYSGVLSIIQNCLVRDKTFTLYGDGKQTRDFVYVKDVINVLDLLLKTKEACWDVYNVATGVSSELNDVIYAFEKAMDKKLNVEYKEARTGDIKDSVADISNLKTLGYSPKYSLLDGLTEYTKMVVD
ncbi:GDP-mannose 4,6-dehydratase [Ligilactobacillus sp. Marseille-Q7487]|jgi:UDP-glucose 4-epimerase|uniref:GDP-mannose 4,6-dehydratase n=1 Tax=Ligilactobacillus sp. Marseille-Q7487 TaxID=3022128 RepID=UPI0015B6428D|nr:GDP-mannose 4,6-dehydratase [Ligilactobacillus sp. Marseille-Q7487]